MKEDHSVNSLEFVKGFDLFAIRANRLYFIIISFCVMGSKISEPEKSRQQLELEEKINFKNYIAKVSFKENN